MQLHQIQQHLAELQREGKPVPSISVFLRVAPMAVNGTFIGQHANILTVETVEGRVFIDVDEIAIVKCHERAAPAKPNAG